MNKHKVTFNGITFTRNSKGRVYTHAVIVTRLIADLRAEQISDAKAVWKMNVDFWTKKANGTSEFLKRNGNRWAREDDETVMKQCQEILDAGVDGLVAERLEKFDAQVARATNKTVDGLCLVTCAGWCGRLDLATKLAASVQRGVPHIMTAERV